MAGTTGGVIEDLLLLIAEYQWAARIDTGRGMFAEHQGMALPIAGPPRVGSRGITGQLRLNRCYFLLGGYSTMTAYYF